MSTAGHGTTTSSLRPLSLGQRPLHLRSTSPAAPSTGSTPTGTPKENFVALSRAEGTPNSTPGPVPGPSVQRHAKRYSTLSYTSSPRTPSTSQAIASPIHAFPEEQGAVGNQPRSPSGTVKPSNGGLSRNNSTRSWKAGGRNSIDVSLVVGPNKRGSIGWERGENASGRASPALASEVSTPKETGPESVVSEDSVGSLASAGADGVNTVLTLAEKHADLLRFIAQKEAKCLELRSQLSQHEADLKALKAKWTSIVQKANPNVSASAASGSIALASAAVIREGVGRLFSNVTAPLASALDALEANGAATSSSSSQKPQTDSLGVIDGSTSSYFPKPAGISEIKAASRGHTPVSSKSSSASSFAASRHSISSASSLGAFEDSKGTSIPKEESNMTGSSVAPLSKVTKRSSLLGGHAFTAEPASNGTTSSDGAGQGSNPLTSWTNVLPELDASRLNKKWEEIQKGETFSKSSKRMSTILSDVSSSFINTFAPPINEPIHSHKPRLTSDSSSSSRNIPQSIPAGSSSNKSLLDDDDDLLSEPVLSASANDILVPLKPAPSPLLAPKPVSPQSQKDKPPSQASPEEDDEVWNW